MSDLPAPTVAWVNGREVDAATAAVSIHDRGLRGEGVFETIRVAVDGQCDAPLLERHLDRAVAGMRVLGLPAPPVTVLRSAAHEFLAALAEHVATTRPPGMAMRLTVTPGPLDPAAPFPQRPHPRAVPTIVLTAHAVAPRSPDDRAALVSVVAQRQLARAKSVSYGLESWASRVARERGGTDALLVDDRGFVSECATANVFLRLGEVLATPPDDGRILPGVTRRLVLDEVAPALGLRIEEREVHVRECEVADEVWLTSSIAGIRAADQLDDRSLRIWMPEAEGGPRPRLDEARAAFEAAVSRPSAAPPRR